MIITENDSWKISSAPHPQDVYAYKLVIITKKKHTFFLASKFTIHKYVYSLTICIAMPKSTKKSKLETERLSKSNVT